MATKRWIITSKCGFSDSVLVLSKALRRSASEMVKITYSEAEILKSVALQNTLRVISVLFIQKFQGLNQIFGQNFQKICLYAIFPTSA